MKMPFYHQQLMKAKKSNPVVPQIMEGHFLSNHVYTVGNSTQTSCLQYLKFYSTLWTCYHSLYLWKLLCTYFFILQRVSILSKWTVCKVFRKFIAKCSEKDYLLNTCSHHSIAFLMQAFFVVSGSSLFM